MKKEKSGGRSREVLLSRLNDVIEVIIPKNRKQLLLWYTILFVVVLFGSYLPLFLFNRTLLWESDDGFLQHYEWLVYLKRAIRQFFSGNGFSFWSWSLGLGADTIGFIGGILFDPFNYFAALFPESHIDLGYTFAIFLRLYVAGLGFLWFGKITGLRLHTSLLGALAYSFSSWLFLCSTRHDTFVTPAVIFVFLMVGVEKILRRQSPLPFIVATFFSAVTAIYFSYMSAILIFIYVLIHYIKNEKKSIIIFLKMVGRFLLYAGISVLLALIVILPNLYTLLNAVTEGAIQYNFFWDFDVYSNYLISLVAGNEMFLHYSTFFASALFLILLPPVILNVIRRKGSAAMVTLLCCLIFLAFPGINAFFNGMGYPAARWCYGTTFFFVWSGLQCMDTSISDIVKRKNVIYGFLIFLAVWLVVICRVVLQLSSEKFVVLGIINIAAGFLMFHIICAINRDQRMKKRVLLVLAVSANLIIFHMVEYTPGVSQLVFCHEQQGSIYNKLIHSTQRAATEIEDNTFYRINQTDFIHMGEAPAGYVNRPYRYLHVPANETLVFNTRSIYIYNSMIPEAFFNLNRDLCNNANYSRRIFAYNNDNRVRLDFLTGVKYFLGNNPRNYPSDGADEYAGYGFEFLKKSSAGVNVLQTKYSLGLGCVFDSYITKEEWLSLDYADREHALMESVVVEGESMSNGLMHKNVNDISSGQKQLSYRIKDITNVLPEDGSTFSEDIVKKFQVSKENGGFTIDLGTEVSDSEVYLMFRGLKRVPEKKKSAVTHNKLEALRSKVQSSTVDNGNFNLYVNNGVTVKGAYNTNGFVSGFSDITDFAINMGVGNKGSKEIKVTFDHVGTYTFDDLQIIAVPLSTFRESANACMENSFATEVISDNYVCGKVDTKKSKSILYLSIPYYKGWRAYVDGRETEVQQIDTAYSGIPITGEGEHKIELKYRPVGFEVGIIAFVLGIIATILVCVVYYRKKKSIIV